MDQIAESPALPFLPAPGEDPVGAGWMESNTSGYLELLGPFWRRTEGNHFMLAFRAAEKHRNSNGVVHGGAIASLADSAMGIASRADERSRRATIQLDLHYLDAAQIGEFVVACCTVKRRTRFVTFVETEILAGDRLVATGMGVWKNLVPKA